MVRGIFLSENTMGNPHGPHWPNLIVVLVDLSTSLLKLLCSCEPVGTFGSGVEVVNGKIVVTEKDKVTEISYSAHELPAQVIMYTLAYNSYICLPTIEHQELRPQI